MSAGPGLDLGRPRDVGELFAEALLLYRRHFGTFLLIAAAIVVPVHLVVAGIGLEELTAPYSDETPVYELAITTAVSFFVVAPLTTATAIYALQSLDRGEHPNAGRSLQAGLDAFAPLFAALALAAAGIALGLAALILPGIYLLVRWFFVPQAVVIDGKRGVESLQHSADLVHGSWWRTFGVVVLVNLAVTIPALVVLTPFTAAAQSADREVISLAGEIVVETLTAPFVAIVSTLLYHDLRARLARGFVQR